MIIGSALLYDDSTVFPGTAAIVPTVGTALVILFGVRAAALGPTTFLSMRSMQFIGLISYSLYLVHWPLLVVAQAAVGEQNPLGVAEKVLLGIVVALPSAWLLFRFVETPMRAPRMLVARRPRATLLVALGTTIMLVVGVGAGVQWSTQRLTGTGGEVAAAPALPQSPPTAEGAVPSNMTPALADVADDLAPVFTDGCQNDVRTDEVQDCEYGDANGVRTIALFGDSHSAQWFPALASFAESNPSTSLRTYTKSSCSAASVSVLVKGVPYTSCDQWRERVVAHLVADPPDVIVISNYAHYVLEDSPDGAHRERLWDEGLRATVQRLRDAGSEVLLIADSPRLRADPATCVSTDVTDVSACDEERRWAIDDGLASVEKQVAVATGAEYIDLTRYICDAAVCPVIIGDMFVYRDVNHMTSTFVEYLAPLVDPTLASLLGVGTGSGT